MSRSMHLKCTQYWQSARVVNGLALKANGFGRTGSNPVFVVDSFFCDFYHFDEQSLEPHLKVRLHLAALALIDLAFIGITDSIMSLVRGVVDKCF